MTTFPGAHFVGVAMHALRRDAPGKELARSLPDRHGEPSIQALR